MLTNFTEWPSQQHLPGHYFHKSKQFHPWAAGFDFAVPHVFIFAAGICPRERFTCSSGSRTKEPGGGGGGGVGVLQCAEAFELAASLDIGLKFWKAHGLLALAALFS